MNSRLKTLDYNFLNKYFNDIEKLVTLKFDIALSLNVTGILILIIVNTFLIDQRLFILKTKGSRYGQAHSGDVTINTVFKVN